MKNNAIVYGDMAREWLDFALGDMAQRMGWEFPQEIVEYLMDLVSDCGIDVSSPSNLMSFTDNAFVNGAWGLLDNFPYSPEEAEQMVENGNALYFNKESELFVEWF